MPVQSLHTAFLSDRSNSSKTSDLVPLVVTYRPQLASFGAVLRQKLHLLYANLKLKNVLLRCLLWCLERPETLLIFWPELRFIPWREEKVHATVVRKDVPHS